jgi:cob(I)alamin adenosyltransferase
VSDDKLRVRLIGQIEGLNAALQLIPATPENVDVAGQLVEAMQAIVKQLDDMEEDDKRQLAFWGVYDGN